MKISPPAFPTWITDDSMAHGMSLRDYFAIHASQDDIQNFIYTEEWDSNIGHFVRRDRQAARYAFADEMLKARKQ